MVGSELKDGNLKIDRLYQYIEKALQEGATDDGQIIKRAYSKNASEGDITSLKHMMNSMKCLSKARCPHKRNKMRFADVMAHCLGAAGKCDFLDYEMAGLYDAWKKNRDEQYSELVDRSVVVRGRIAESREITRARNERFYHLHILDTEVMTVDDIKGKKTRSLRVEIQRKFQKKCQKSCLKNCWNQV